MKQDSNKNEFDGAEQRKTLLPPVLSFDLPLLSEEQTNKLQQIFGINKGRKFGEIKANNDKGKINSKVKRFFRK